MLLDRDPDNRLYFAARLPFSRVNSRVAVKLPELPVSAFAHSLVAPTGNVARLS
jgi:hypothetical protein